jgi:DNA-binding MarR family transcriptional regulator
VSASLLSAMWSVERLQPVTLGELAAAERIQPPTITRIVAKLEELGLVAREGHPTDRRASHVRLTRKGQALLDRTRTLRTAYLARRLGSLTAEDRRTLERAVEVLRRLVEEDDP